MNTTHDSVKELKQDVNSADCVQLQGRDANLATSVSYAVVQVFVVNERVSSANHAHDDNNNSDQL